MQFRRFHGRAEAARALLAGIRNEVRDDARVVVVSVPRGGVVLGGVVSDALRAPHEICVARRVVESRRQEWSIGAVAEDGSHAWDAQKRERETPAYLRRAVLEARREARRRTRAYREGRKRVAVRGKTVVLVDDGLARGFTLLAAVRMLRRAGAARIVVAVPVADARGMRMVQAEADAFIAAYVPKRFRAVGAYYHWFAQVGDARVQRILRRAGKVHR